MDSCAEVPIGIGLIVCDTIIEDKLTNKKSLIGLFGQIHAAKLPCLFNSMSLLVSLTGGNGEYPCQILCQHAASNATIFKLTCTITFKSPLQVLDLVFQLKHVKFPLPGQYWIKVVIDEIPIMMRPLTVMQNTTRTNKDDGNADQQGGDENSSGPQDHTYPGPQDN